MRASVRQLRPPVRGSCGHGRSRKAAEGVAFLRERPGRVPGTGSTGTCATLPNLLPVFTVELLLSIFSSHFRVGACAGPCNPSCRCAAAAAWRQHAAHSAQGPLKKLYITADEADPVRLPDYCTDTTSEIRRAPRLAHGPRSAVRSLLWARLCIDNRSLPITLLISSSRLNVSSA